MRKHAVHRVLVAVSINPASCLLVFLGAICGCVLDTEPLSPQNPLGSEEKDYLVKSTGDPQQLALSKVIEKAGNVGIGTNAPQNLLHVTGSMEGSASGGISIEYEGGRTMWTVDTGNNNSARYGKLQFAWRNRDGITGADGTAMSLTDDGNVGIGTAEPDEKLVVQGGNIRVSQVLDGGKFVGGMIQVGASTTEFSCVKVGSGSPPCTQETDCCPCRGSQEGGITYNGHFYGCRGYGGEGAMGPCGARFCWVQLDNKP